MKMVVLHSTRLFLPLIFATGTFLSGVLAEHEHPEIPPPSAQVYLVKLKEDSESDLLHYSKDGKNSMVEDKLLLNDIVNTDVEIHPGQNIQLECKADQPVQWNYQGPGKPEFMTKVEVGEEDSKEVHKASLLIRNANDKDTGKYACRYAEFPKVHASYHIFVPGPDIFVPNSGKTLIYANGDDSILIPCPVSTKAARVSLRKVFFDDSLRSVDQPLAKFDPKYGFRLSVKDFRDAEGVYVCTGYSRGNLRILEFTLRSEEHNETAVKFPDHEDLNPCLSYSCPSGSQCRVNPNTYLPFCACRPKSGLSSQSNCTRLCKSSNDCPRSEKCQFSIAKQLKMCIHACDDHKCGENAECYVDEHRGIPKCRCRRGFQGNANIVCERIPFKQDTSGNSYCTNAKCGPNAKCQNVDGRVQCACFAALGTWPNCVRACTSDIDCDRQDKCDFRRGICEPVCSKGICAPKADCKVVHRKPMCLCPPGYTGKATEACYQSHFYYRSRTGFSLGDTDVPEFFDSTTELTTPLDDQIFFYEDVRQNNSTTAISQEIDNESTERSSNNNNDSS